MFALKSLAVAAALSFVASACAQEPDTQSAPEQATDQPAAGDDPSRIETAVYAGGCFWCIEADLEKLEGVGDVVAGYSGGEIENPTYRNHGRHLEVVRAPYDPSVISYRELTTYFLRHIDPFDAGGQFCDRGNTYTTAIFYQTAEEKEIAEELIALAETELEAEIVTPVRELGPFWIAEGYHQDYYKKNPARYQFYRAGCRRDARVKQIWGE